MLHITKKELREMMLHSYDRVEAEKEEINKINVFPVPDQDTGNNIAKTLLGVKEALAGKEFKNLNEISEAALDGALTAAQGNAGVIYTGFLAGFLLQLDGEEVDIKKIGLAFEKGAERAKLSIQNPQEGTILDVINAATLAIKQESGKQTDIIKVFKIAVEKSGQALLETREKMEIFKKANVVDAGGMGFLIIMESYLEALEGKKEKIEKDQEVSSEKIKRFVQVLSNRYEVVSLIKNLKFKEEEIREQLRRLGNCLDIVQVKDKIKIHIHTDYPDEVKEVMRSFGQIQNLRTEDMAHEVVGEESVRMVSIGLVTDNTTMLLPKIIERYQIEQVFYNYDWPETEKVKGENIYEKLANSKKDSIKTLPNFNFPAEKDYLAAFERQLEKFNRVLCITASSKLFDSYRAARRAKERLPDPKRVFVLDSANFVAGQSLLVLLALELIQEQREMQEVIDLLRKAIAKINLYIIIKDTSWIGQLKNMPLSNISWLKKLNKLGLYPVMKIRKGSLVKVGAIFGRQIAKNISQKIIQQMRKDLKKHKGLRMVMGQSDNMDLAKDVKKALKEKTSLEVSFINLTPFSVAGCFGPGSLFLGWMAI